MKKKTSIVKSKKSGEIVKKTSPEAVSNLMGSYDYVPGHYHTLAGMPYYVPGHLHYTPGAGWAFHDHKDEYMLVAEMPGISKEGIDIKVTPERAEICVTGKEKSKEMHYSQLCRAVNFDEDVILEKAKASLKDGVLELRIPKKAPKPKGKEHKVKVG